MMFAATTLANERRTREVAEGTPLRRCFITGAVAPKAGLVRFVISPEGAVVPDVAETLPGRGLWLSADAGLIAEACRGNRFARASRQAVKVAPDLPAVVESQLLARCSDIIRLARRADRAVFGYDRVRTWLATLADGKKGGLLVLAADAEPEAARRLGANAKAIRVVRALTAAELGACFNRERVVYAGVDAGPLAKRLAREVLRLAGLRAEPTARTNGRQTKDGKSGRDGGYDGD